MADLSTLERLHVLSDYEQDLLFEKKVEIICRTAEWGMENEQVGLVASLSDSWTPEQCERFLFDWQNDEPLLEIHRGPDCKVWSARGTRSPRRNFRSFFRPRIYEICLAIRA